MDISVLIINKSTNPLPKYQTLGSAGMDISAFLDQAVELKPLERVVIPTGLYVQIPQGFEIQIRPRSGLAIKEGLTVINAPGTIDSDYRGELRVGIVNLSQDEKMIKNGDRIAQMVLAKHEQISWKIVSVLDDTERGEGGFGHTGK